MAKKQVKPTKIKIKVKKGDMVQIIAGKDKGKKGKILLVDRVSNRVIVEGANMVSRHTKPNRSRQAQQGGIVRKESPLDASNVMYLHKGEPTRIGYVISTKEQDGKKLITRQRIAKKTGDVIDESTY